MTDDNPYAQFAPKQDDNPYSAFVQPKAGPTMSARTDDGSLQGDGLPSRIFRKIDDFVRSIANGATFGLADKAAAGADSVTQGIPYSEAAGREAFDTQRAKERSPDLSLAGGLLGGMATGGAASKAVEAVVPALGRATIPSMAANNAVIGTAGSAVGDLSNGELPDPKKALLAGVLGGAAPVAVSPILRQLSAGARLRAAGADLSDAEKTAATGLMKQGSDIGVPLSVPEAVAAAAPGNAGRVQATLNNAVRSPEGSTVWADFEAKRPPLVAQAARRTADSVAQGTTPAGIPAQQAAQQGLDDAKTLVSNSADPYYKKAEKAFGFKIPQTVEVNRARTQVADDPTLQEFLGRSPANSLKTLDLVKQQMGANYEAAQAKPGTAPLKSAIIADDKTKLDTALKRNNDYATATSIHEQGNQQLLGPLADGPLGKIAKTTNPDAQAAALYDVATPQAGQAASNAAARMPATVPQGLLSDRLSSMASRDPMSIGSKLLPTDESRAVATQVMPPQKMADVNKLISVLQTMDPKAVQAGGFQPHGVTEEAWRAVRNIGTKKVAEMLQDPAVIAEFGKVGNPERITNALTTVLGVAAANSPSLRKRSGQ